MPPRMPHSDISQDFLAFTRDLLHKKLPLMSLLKKVCPENFKFLTWFLYLINNGAELGGATGAMAPLVFWSRSLKKSRKVSKSKSHSLEWHQLFLTSFGADVNDVYSIFFLFIYKK